MFSRVSQKRLLWTFDTSRIKRCRIVESILSDARLLSFFRCKYDFMVCVRLRWGYSTLLGMHVRFITLKSFLIDVSDWRKEISEKKEMTHSFLLKLIFIFKKTHNIVKLGYWLSMEEIEIWSLDLFASFYSFPTPFASRSV